jgi:hypothetical protein
MAASGENPMAVDMMVQGLVRAVGKTVEHEGDHRYAHVQSGRSPRRRACRCSTSAARSVSLRRWLVDHIAIT